MMSSEEFKCVFCKESFTDKESLQVHFRKHGDKNFHSKKSRSQDEPIALPDKPASNKDQTEIVECDVCPEVFTSISKAITHKHKVHPDHDAKYFCPWCGKLFTMKHLYNKHIDSTHKNNEAVGKDFICEVCAVEFHLPTAMSYHNKFFHRIHEMPTIGNSKKLKMFNLEAIQLYYCPFCGEEYDNKINLHKHMNDDHHDENQNPVDVLRCPVCEAIFYHLDAYELHLTYHSVDDMYSERSTIMDEITDFSLETVPPLAEKIESVESNEDGRATGIEQLFELTMDDKKLKKKKHKKHKKSKKSAITLDQFLNMNTDVFGEGLDFQGIEEVPTRTITKSLKKYSKKPTQSKLPPDIEKLKRQGIVVKKKPGPKPVKRLTDKPNQIVNKTPNTATQSKPNTLATPNEVLTKLINQNNSQIKIVKKSSLETKNTNETTGDTEQDSPTIDSKKSVEKTELNENKTTSSISKENDVITEDNIAHDPDPSNDGNVGTNKSPKPENKMSMCSENDEEESNNSQSILDEDPQTKRDTKVDKLTALRNNSNIVVKSSQQTVPEVNKNNPSHDSDENVSNHEDTDPEDAEPNCNGKSDKNESFNALKHLSHLIVKPCGQEIKHAKLDHPQGIVKKVEPPEVSKIAHLIRNKPAKIVPSIVKNSTPVALQTNTPLRIKTVDPDPNNYDSEDENDVQNDKIIAEPVQSDKLASILNNPHLNVQAIRKSPQIVSQKESPTENLTKNDKTSTDLLKHLKNVTAKPVGVDKTVNMSISSPKVSPKLMNVIKKEPTPPVKLTKVIQQDIEIYKIDDSDSDEANSNTVQTNQNKEIPTMNKSADVLKNINKNITIKSVINKPPRKVVNKAQMEEFHSDDDVGGNDETHDAPLPNTCNPKLSDTANNHKQSALNNVLKNLSKNITVKSGNSPGHFTMSEDQKSEDSNFAQNDDVDSDTDSLSGRVKITEMKDESDEELHKDDDSNDVQGNVKVQYPDDSDNEERNDNDEFGDNDSDDDVETHIPASAVKNNSVSKPNLDSLKNVCKDLVIKPSGQTLNRTPQPTSDEIPPFAKSLSSKISTKNMKQDTKQVKLNNTNFRNANKSIGQSVMNKSAINRIASTSNQVNKEVKTVKTFQSQTQTVIEEITTTVTKTIKTVNQSMKQEIRNAGPSTSTPQKIQHLNASNKNFQGVKVRQSAPMPAGPRVRNPGMRPTRPVLPAPIQTNNQLVAVRPRFNPPRTSNPRMPVVRPSTSNQPRPQKGKFAPGVVPVSGKRPNTEPPGHFSCFKKTKESLFPEVDFSAMNKTDCESAVQFSSTMQMSKSNFASTTKTVKGNSVVTATQMKSEMCASSQQLGKLRNLSGLSVVKTNQTNQSHVEEKSERSAANQNTLDAIQKLQNQGLLVKKPRLVSEEDEHTNPGSDDVNNFSDEEFGT